MRGRPPKRRFTAKQKRAADAFIEAAEPSRGEQPEGDDPPAEPTASEEPSQTYPWQEPHVREDVKKGYALRLPEPLYLKLKYVSEETGRSMNELCNDAIEQAVEEQLQQID